MAGKLLEGRIAVFVAGTPVVLTIPYLSIETLQSNKDYYLSFYYTSFSRFLRIAGFLLTIIISAPYIAIVSFHQEILPDPLMINVAADIHNVPLPAAVEADLVPAPMIIVTAITGITSLLIPKMNASVILIRLAQLLSAICFGRYGLVLGLAVLFIHILKLESFGVSQVVQDRPFRYQRVKDTLLLAPWRQMITRPQSLTRNKVRQARNGEERVMKRHILLICLAAMLPLTLAGGYDSRGMDEINIVAGIAIAKGDDDQYKITWEIVDLSSKEDTSGPETILVKSEGPTIF